MRSIILYVVLAIAIVGVSSVLAQNTSQYDTDLLLDIVRHALTQIESQLSTDADDDIQELVVMGKAEVEQLEIAVETNNIESIKLHFINAMGIFKQISIETTTHETKLDTQNSDVPTASTTKLEPISSSSDESESLNYDDILDQFYRLQNQVVDLKVISQQYNIDLDFTILDSLIVQGIKHIEQDDLESLIYTIQSIDESIQEINIQLEQDVAEQEFKRAKTFADLYLKEIDSLITDITKQQISDAIISEIKIIKERIKSANTTDDIVLEIKKIILVREHLDMTKKYRLEAKVAHLEQTISELNRDDKLQELANIKDIFGKIKYHLRSGEYDTARYMTIYLDDQIRNLRLTTNYTTNYTS